MAQLLYRSVSRDGADSGLRMSDILNEARAGNARDGITGVLTAVNGQFLQIIEGPEAALNRLMVKLQRDPRHTDLTVIERRPTARRRFGDWDMVSPRLASREVALLALLLHDPAAGIDAYAEILARAVAAQEAVLEGRSSVNGTVGASPPKPGFAEGSEA